MPWGREAGQPWRKRSCKDTCTLRRTYTASTRARERLRALRGLASPTVPLPRPGPSAEPRRGRQQKPDPRREALPRAELSDQDASRDNTPRSRGAPRPGPRLAPPATMLTGGSRGRAGSIRGARPTARPTGREAPHRGSRVQHPRPLPGQPPRLLPGPWTAPRGELTELEEHILLALPVAFHTRPVGDLHATAQR